jgi:hypothetical protein
MSQPKTQNLSRNQGPAPQGLTDCACAAEIEVPTLTERLRIKRANLARELTRRIKELDTQIRLLENSEAEKIISEAQQVLWEG